MVKKKKSFLCTLWKKQYILLLFLYLVAVFCGVPAIPENGDIDVSSFTYGSKVTYR